MADAKLSALTAITTATSDDLMYLVDDPSGTPTSKKITVASFFTSPALITPVINGTVYGMTTTATAAGTTTMTIASAKQQVWTGSTTQTVRLPTTSVVAGGEYSITNTSTGLVVVQSSGLNNIVTLGLNQTALFTALVATPTTAANWTYAKLNLAGNTNGKRILVVTQSATPAINTNNGDIIQITGLAQAITSMTSGLTGTPNEGDMIQVQFTDNATARAITWGASYESSGTVTLPSTTVASTKLTVGLNWNAVTSKWRCDGIS